MQLSIAAHAAGETITAGQAVYLGKLGQVDEGR
jgi:hypothetical protein